MIKAFLFFIVFSIVFVSISVFILTQSEEISTEEGFLYSIVGCTSLYQKLEEPEKAKQMLNFIHSFSENQNITEIQPGYISRFIKLVEKKWQKENEVAKRNCEGILKKANGEPTPKTYNAVTQSVIVYLSDITKKEKETATQKAHRVLKERGIEIPEEK